MSHPTVTLTVDPTASARSAPSGAVSRLDPGSLGSSRRLVGASMLAAPALMAVAAGLFAGDVGVNPEPFDDGSWVEGIFGVFALAAFIPVYLALANRLTQHRPRLGGIARVTGIIGAACGVVWESLRVFSHGFVEAGMTPAQAQQFQDDIMTYASPLSAALLFPVTSMLLGFGLAGRGLPRWQGVAIAGGGIGFMSAHALGVAMKFTYPVGAALWAVALIPLGIETLRGIRARRADAA